MTQHDTPQVYIACLAAYNQGHLHGKWVDATDVDTIWDEIKEVIKSSPADDAEEWAFHDYSGFGKIDLGEYESPETIAKWAELIEEHGDALVGGLQECLGSNPEETKKYLEDNYVGHYQNLEEYAYDYFKECHSGDIPEWIETYIDFEKMGRELGYDLITVEDGHASVHIFYNS